MNKFFIAVANHTPISKKSSEKYYYNILAGADNKVNSETDISLYSFYDYFDNEGINISYRNKYYCELTVIYWMWKNIKDAEYYGLVHYRRIFTGPKAQKLYISSLDFDILLPKAKNYFPFNVLQHYSVSHYKSDLEILRKIISEKFPEYSFALEETLNSNKLHLYNMFIMRKEYFNDYSSWLFAILEEAYGYDLHLNRSHYQSRVYGFLGERLFNVWLVKKMKENKLNIIYRDVKELNTNSRFVRGVEWLLRLFKVIEKK